MINEYCVIGYPVKHSLSPFIYNKLFEIYKINDSVYSYKEIKPTALKNFINFIKNTNIRGFNATMPLKTELLPYLTFTDISAKYGTNTVIVTSNGLSGYSTDAIGFYKSLELLGKKYKGNNILFLGCGAVTRALINDALQKGAKSITVLNRTIAKIADLKKISKIQIGDLSDFKNHLNNCNLLINTTPIGMNHINYTLDYSCLKKLPKSTLVCDLIYEPAITPLLEAAKSNGNPILNGLDMLIWQAFYSFKIYCNILPNLNDYSVIKKSILCQKSMD